MRNSLLLRASLPKGPGLRDSLSNNLIKYNITKTKNANKSPLNDPCHLVFIIKRNHPVTIEIKRGISINWYSSVTSVSLPQHYIIPDIPYRLQKETDIILPKVLVNFWVLTENITKHWLSTDAVEYTVLMQPIRSEVPALHMQSPRYSHC